MIFRKGQTVFHVQVQTPLVVLKWEEEKEAKAIECKYKCKKKKKKGVNIKAEHNE